MKIINIILLWIIILASISFGMGLNNIKTFAKGEIIYKNNTYFVAGLDHEDYTFIIKDKITTNYADTVIHEACHEYIKRDYKHFCEG